jgi:hypothetical protein
LSYGSSHITASVALDGKKYILFALTSNVEWKNEKLVSREDFSFSKYFEVLFWFVIIKKNGLTPESNSTLLNVF